VRHPAKRTQLRVHLGGGIAVLAIVALTLSADLEINQLGRRDAFCGQTPPCRLPVDSVICQRRCEYACVNDEHGRFARLARQP
jgi:hypothetical protein